MSKETNIPVEKLFGSKTRAKLLALFFENTEKSYYVREITRVVEEQINSVRRELDNLGGIGIVKSETFDNKIYYSANTKHPFCRPLSEMFSKKIDIVKDATSSHDGWGDYVRMVRKYLKALVVTNRMPGQEGIDLLIIGDDRTKKLTHWAELVEKKQGKPLNYVIMKPDDYIYRKNVRDRFIADVMEMDITDKYDPEYIL